MAIWIQSLSWAIIYGLGQGLIVYLSLWLLLNMVRGVSSNVKYHLSLSALTILLAWFGITWWQQYHSLLNEPQLAGAVWAINTAPVTINTIDINYPNKLFSLSSLFPLLSVGYLTGLMLMLVRLAGGILVMFRLKTVGVTNSDDRLNDLLAGLKSKLNIGSRVQLFTSVKAKVPMVIGFFKPVILMPVAVMAQLNTQQLETILLHELAHIKRYDYLVNILQTIAETILFFNPFVWFISGIVRREREHCCDDYVTAHTTEPLFYATALAALADHRTNIPALTIAASGTSNHLFNRIKRIMEMKKNSFSYSRMVAAVLMISAITCSVVWLTPSFAKTAKDKSVETSIKSAPVVGDISVTDQQETARLVQKLIDDKMVNEIKGFSIEKKQDKFYINGHLQTEDITGKYLSGVKQDVITVQVFSLEQRMKMHPNVNMLQILAPTTFSSPCVDYKKKKDGC